jgi:hypothetical protein
MSAVRRRRLHARVGEILIGTESPAPDAVVHHLRRAGDARLVEWLITAAQRAQRAYANASAVARYEEAWSLLATAPPTATHFIVLSELAVLRRFRHDSIAYAEEAVAMARRLRDPVLEAAAMTRLALNRTYVESLTAGLGEQEAALALLETLPESATHWFTAYRARYAGRYAGGNLIDQATVRGHLVMTLALLGRYTDAAAHFDAGDTTSNGVIGRVLCAAMRGDPVAARSAIRAYLAQLGTATPPEIAGLPSIELAQVLIPYEADNAAEVRRVTAAVTAAWALQREKGSIDLPATLLCAGSADCAGRVGRGMVAAARGAWPVACCG